MFRKFIAKLIMKNNIAKLTELKNIGVTLAEKLCVVGIETPQQLIATGSENAFIKLITIDKKACINQLYALEGAIQEKRWHDLSSERKMELLEFYRILNK